MDRRTRGGRPRRPSRPPPPRRPRPKNRPRRRPPTVAVKLIIRRLPPLLSAEEFAKVAGAHGADRAIWRSYMPGSVENTGSVKRTAHVVSHSVAYLGFEKLEQAVAFHDAFNAYKFVDTAKTASGILQTGSEYYACVERAMSQNVPPLQRRNPPPMTGTIEADPDYQAFLKTLESEQRERPISLGQTSAMFPSPNDEKRRAKEVVTPLMEDVRAKRKERDDKKRAKNAPRSGRKPRQVAEQRAATPVGKTLSRKKKRRGGEAASAAKRDETPTSDRKPPAKPERRNGIVPRRDEENMSTNSQASASNKTPPHFAKSGANNKSPSHFTNTNTSKNPPHSANSGASKSPTHFTNAGATQSNGSATGAKTAPRNANRSRYGRGSRGKAKFPVGNSPGRAAHHAQDSVHSPVRVLKKEASTTSAT